MYSVLIRGARVLDGTGNPWFAADLAAEGDTLRVLPAGSTVEAQRVIEAQGHVAAPGFIDLHTHASLLPFNAPGMEPFVRQGVTTVVVGLDGHSYAPFASGELYAPFAELNAPLEGPAPNGAGWPSVASYLEAADRRSACNVATLVGNGTLRLAVLGWESRYPSGEELEEMGRLLEAGLEQGAFGLSWGPAYPPSSEAHPEEVARLCQAMRRIGGLLVTHLRVAPGEGLTNALHSVLAVVKGGAVSLHLSPLHVSQPAGAEPVLAALDKARCEGMDVTFDTSPYPYLSTRMTALLPAWVCAGGPHALRRRLRDRKERLQIARDPEWLGRDFRACLVTNLSRRAYHAYEGWPLESVAQALGKSVLDTLCGLLLEEHLAPSCVLLGGSAVSIRRLFQHPAHLVASGSAPVGARCNPRAYGTFAQVLGAFCREEGVLSLADAVRRMTALPARRLGLRDRGLLRDGMKADLVVFDPARVGSPATLEDPRQLAQGIEWVIVNGVPVVTPEGSTGAFPGRALRSGMA